MGWGSAIEPGAGWGPPGVPAAPRKRPGIQTTIYRAEPGTRDFVFGEGLDAPGASAKLQDRLSYNQQLMDAMQASGGSQMNSPQFAALAAQNDSGWKALNDQMSAQAAQSSAGTQAQTQSWQESPESFRRQVLAHQIQAGTASQEAIEGAGGSPNASVAASEAGLDQATSLDDAAGRLGVQGKLPLGSGSPLRRALSVKYGPELAARQAGQPAHWYEHTLGTPGLNVGDVLQLGIPAVMRYFGGVPSWKQQQEQMVGGLFGGGGSAPGLPAAAAQPAIATPEKKPRKPGVAMGGAEPSFEVRNSALDKIRRGQP